MKNEMTMPMSLSARIRQHIQSVGEGLSQLYSAIMEEPVSVSQSWKIMHASVALVVTAFFPLSLPLRMLSVVWMLYALLDCKRSGLK